MKAFATLVLAAIVSPLARAQEESLRGVRHSNKSADKGLAFPIQTSAKETSNKQSKDLAKCHEEVFIAVGAENPVYSEWDGNEESLPGWAKDENLWKELFHCATTHLKIDNFDEAAALEAIRSDSWPTFIGSEHQARRSKCKKPEGDKDGGSCVNDLIDVAQSSVSLGMTVTGLPSAVGKKISKKMVKKARDKLRKTIKCTMKKYFKSMKDFKQVGYGFIEIVETIKDGVSWKDLRNIIWEEMTFWNALSTLASFLAIIGSGGAALAHKIKNLAEDIRDLTNAVNRSSASCGVDIDHVYVPMISPDYQTV